MSTFLKIALNKIRAILLLRYSPDIKKELQEEFSTEDYEFLDGIANKKESAIKAKTIVDLLTAGEQMRFSPIPELPLELIFEN